LKRFVAALPLAGLLGNATLAHAAEFLRGEPSAFLQASADSPVDWMPWGEAAIARAKREQKPVFLFVGSFTSELARAMCRQTFSSPKTAEWMNKNFVCVIVDRVERPDVAALYHAYVENAKQLDGWPLNVWLTPEFMPFEGATYLSPSEDWGAPGFLKLASQVGAAWSADPSACRRRALDAAAQLAPATRAEPHSWSPEKTALRLSAAAGAWRAVFDGNHGGFGDLPRAPEPELLRFLLRQSPADRQAAISTLRALSSSAVRDPLDGGFFRYAADAAWRVPYPQKTLADQARIALAYIDAANGPDAKAFELSARGALDFALGRLARPDGTFAAAQDATSDEFSRYYSWTEAEIDGALGADSAAFKRGHGVVPDGNVPPEDDPTGLYSHRNLLRSDPEAAAAMGPAARLLAVRDRRPAPPVDERATAGAHGLLLSALSRAGMQYAEPRYAEAARRVFDAAKRAFLSSEDGTLRRLDGSALPAAPDDYAALALGCRDFARATGDKEATGLATRLLEQLDRLYYDPVSSRYFAAPPTPGPGLFERPFEAGDQPDAVSVALPIGAGHAKAIAAALSDSLGETSAPGPGDELLGLTLFSADFKSGDSSSSK
jgi:uncharacterized protein YyaL (SSP411 family)